MNDHDIDELMRGEAAHAPVGDGGDLRRGRMRLLRQRLSALGVGGGSLAIALIAVGAIGPTWYGQPGPASEPDPMPTARTVHNPDGSITVEFAPLDNTTGIEAELSRLGIAADAAYAPWHKQCEQPRFTLAPNSDAVVKRLDFFDNDEYGVTIYPDRLEPNQTVVIQTADVWASTEVEGPDADGPGLWMDAAVTNGPVEPCRLVDNDDSLPAFPSSQHE